MFGLCGSWVNGGVRVPEVGSLGGGLVGSVGISWGELWVNEVQVVRVDGSVVAVLAVVRVTIIRRCHCRARSQETLAASSQDESMDWVAKLVAR
ncbi:hypothetical protein V6N11_063047 [Hibiscus sabdariffa]|uniref:Uncharacterized protein n=2 Tax=Hibiscus sabdariffa TaxID=183260 RepID=A0ABR2NQI2_9ROSI